MRKMHLLGALAVFIAIAAHAQDRHVLLEACGALKSAERRAKVRVHRVPPTSPATDIATTALHANYVL